MLLVFAATARGEGSIDFNGGSTEDKTSKLQNASADVLGGSQQVTVSCWINAESRGQGNLGYVFVLDDEDGDAAFSIFHYSFADDTLIIAKKAGMSGTSGVWTIPVADESWNSLSVTLDFSGDNDPTARVNSASVTVTPGTAPDEIQDLPAPGYCVGNNAGQTRTWDGRIAHVQVFNRVLSAAEQDVSLQAPGSIKHGLRLWLPMRNASDTVDQSGNGFDATATDVETGFDGPIVNSKPGVPVGTWQVPVGTNSLKQYFVPRYANGVSHPAGQVIGHGPASVIQGTSYGPSDGSEPLPIVQTQEYGELMRQWQAEIPDEGNPPITRAVLVPTFADLTIAGRDFDGTGYVYHPNIATYNSPVAPSPSTAPQTPDAVFSVLGNEGVTFNATTSRIQHDTADVLDGVKDVTVCCWVRGRPWGENGQGYIITLDELGGFGAANAAFGITHNPSNSELQIFKNSTAGTNGVWKFSAADGAWNAVCVRLDFSADNDPTARVNFHPAAVVLANPEVEPDGIAGNPSGGYCIGNRDNEDRTWHGQIAHVQVWNRILSDEEADDALENPGSVTDDLRLYLPLTSAADTDNDATATGSAFDPDTTESLATHPGFYNREIGLGVSASGTRIKGLRHFNIAGPAAVVIRPNGSTEGQSLLYDEEMIEIDDISIYRCYAGYELHALDGHMGSYEAQYCRDWGLKFSTQGAWKVRGPVHVSGVFSGRPDSQSPAVWFTDAFGTCWGGPWYVETSDIGMLLESSGAKLGPFYSHTCYQGNLRILGQRNSISNFEIDPVDGVTEVFGREGIWIANQSCMLTNGTIGGGAHGPVPSGEIAIRLVNGVRQVIRDVNFVGTQGSTAPLISVDLAGQFNKLKHSTINAKCFGAGTFLDLYYRVASGTAQGGTSSTIQLAASEVFADDALNSANVHITGGTGVGQVRAISDYVGATDTATVSPNWTTAPNSTSVYEINWDVLGIGNKIEITAENFTQAIDLDPTGWDDTNNQIYVNGVLQTSP